MSFLLYYLPLTILLLIIAARSIRIIKRNERAVLFRFGKFVSIHSGPVVILIPYIDQIVRVRTQQIEGSERMSEKELMQRIAQIYQS